MCPNAYKLSVYFDGELSERRRKPLSRHIQFCQACRSTLHMFEFQREILGLQEPTIDNNADHYRKFWNYVGKARLARISGPRRIEVPLPLAVAALILISILGVLNFVSRSIDGDRVFSHEPTVITFSISPSELESLLSYLEEARTNSDISSVHTLPLTFTRLGDPLMIRSAVIEGEP